MDLCVDAEKQQILNDEITTDQVHDCQKLIPLLEKAQKNQQIKIDTLSADVAYQWNNAINYRHKHKIDPPLIPLPKNAILSEKDPNKSFTATPRNSLLLRQYDLGGLTKI